MGKTPHVARAELHQWGITRKSNGLHIRGLLHGRWYYAFICDLRNNKDGKVMCRTYDYLLELIGQPENV